MSLCWVLKTFREKFRRDLLQRKITFRRGNLLFSWFNLSLMKACVFVVMACYLLVLSLQWQIDVFKASLWFTVCYAIKQHCIKSVHFQSFSGALFPVFGLHQICPSSVQMRENTDRKAPNTDTFYVAVNQKN